MGTLQYNDNSAAFAIENVSQLQNVSQIKRGTERFLLPQHHPKAQQDLKTGRIRYGSQFTKATQPASRKYLVKHTVEFWLEERPEKLKKEVAIPEQDEYENHNHSNYDNIFNEGLRATGIIHVSENKNMDSEDQEDDFYSGREKALEYGGLDGTGMVIDNQMLEEPFEENDGYDQALIEEIFHKTPRTIHKTEFL